MPRTPASHAFAVVLRASLLAAFGAGLIELVAGYVHPGAGHYGFGDLLSALPAALGLWGLFGLVFGLAQAIAVAGIAASFGEGARPGAVISRWRSNESADLSAAAGLVAVGVALLVEIVLVRTYLLAIGLKMARHENAAMSGGLVAAVGLVVLVALGPALFQGARSLVRLLPRPRALVLVATFALLVAVAIVRVMGTIDWRVMDFGPYRGLGLYVLLELAHLAFWTTYGERRFASLVRSSAPRNLLVALLVLAFASFGLAWTRFGGSRPAVQLVAEETGMTRLLLHAARGFSDDDHDGYAGRLGGGDCNDHDAAVNPGAEELAGNGVDDDCDGEDAQKRTKIAARTEQPKVEHTFPKDLNVLVITIDTLRADRLDAQHMPRTFAFASKGVRFMDAYAQAPNTPRSFPSFLTSRLPSQVKWTSQHLNFPGVVPASAGGDPTFFEVLAKLGVAPHGVFSHFYLKPENGIAGGFASWDDEGALTLHDSNTDIAAPRITKKVVAELAELGTSHERFALWTHLFEPHSKYMDHPEFPSHSPGTKGLEEKYDGEVAFADQHVGMMLDALDKAGLTDKTIVVLMADHGEAFGEHRFAGERMFFHGQTLYDELLRVPLVIRVPGIEPREVKEPVMLIDLGPTLVDLAGGTPPPSMMGRSLVPALLGRPLPEVPVMAELLPAPSWQHKWRAVVSGGWKLLDKQSEGSLELYDLKKDPTEQKSLTDAEPAKVKSLRALFVK